MERIFTPWRQAYVTSGSREPGCVMCRALETAFAEGSLVVHVAELNFVLMNLFPYSGGHIMIAPRRHVGTLSEASSEELGEMMALARRAEAVYQDVYRPHGLNIGMNLGKVAGAGVAEHIHLHVVPRWSGDSNFMTTVAGTRVIPEDPAQAALRLRGRFA